MDCHENIFELVSYFSKYNSKGNNMFTVFNRTWDTFSFETLNIKYKIYFKLAFGIAHYYFYIIIINNNITINTKPFINIVINGSSSYKIAQGNNSGICQELLKHVC